MWIHNSLFTCVDGKPADAPHYITLTDNSLYITKTELSDEGSYIVSASNPAGTVEEMVRVTIVAPVPPDSEWMCERTHTESLTA